MGASDRDTAVPGRDTGQGVRQGVRQGVDETRARGVLFDKDGTLVDFHAMWLPAYRDGARRLAELRGDADLAPRVLAATGYDAAVKGLEPGSLLMVGATSEIAADWVARANFSDPGDAARATREVLAVFQAHAGAAPRAIADLGALMARLSARGMALGVATMDTTDGARAGLAALGIAAQLDFVAGCDAGFGVKPAPGMVHAFARAMGLSASQVVVVGDSPGDLAMGRAAGAHACIGVLSGVGRRHELEPLADALIDSVADLEAVLP